MKYNVKRHAVVQPLDSNIRYIPLTRGKHAIVDADLYEFLMQWTWCVRYDPDSRRWYAITNIRTATGRAMLPMHRIIMNAPEGTIVDHRDTLATLDNRRDNLRFATVSQNAANSRVSKNNTSGYVGVTLCRCTNLWRAKIGVAKKELHLGRFKTREEAALAYNKAAIKYFGEFAHLNVIPDQPCASSSPPSS